MASTCWSAVAALKKAASISLGSGRLFQRWWSQVLAW